MFQLGGDLDGNVMRDDDQIRFWGEASNSTKNE